MSCYLPFFISEISKLISWQINKWNKRISGYNIIINTSNYIKDFNASHCRHH